ncbi:dockerin type I repeat-containing protein [Botrimarina mediterranea]|uniref:Dockerin domain-containing protein n=1 Tax=Botrimarina mediterranea TaxID=2528022 RepID=A0A518K471_9BACT|nr:dockerin type I repeat-containing protein [Botrimarina mediterranea]QDV72594.1 hypothetical protein Spa11_07730 [Botrimarina mediterranea]QDV77166.1 hypothetical protein K2D_07540 [Planctomycetes bacterium K2D]
MSSRLLRYASAAALLLTVASNAFGHGEGVLVQRQGDRLVTGYDSDAPGGQTIGTRVFSSYLPSNGLTTDPSFLSVSPAPAGTESLAAGEDVFWDFLPLTTGGVTSNLMHWDGAGEPNFITAEDASLTLYDPNFIAANVDGAAAAVPGERVGTTTSNALALHAHRYWELAGAGEAAAAPGVYVASLRLRMDGLAPTKSLYFAFATFGTPIAALSETVVWLNDRVDSLLLRGDYNFDGSVNAADYDVWSQQYGSATPTPVTVGEADGNGDGVINAADYTVWRDSIVASSSLLIPEPATILLVGAPMLVVVSRRRCYGRPSTLPMEALDFRSRRF